MKMNKKQLKQIIKEELSGVLREMNPDLGGLPQGEEEMAQALDVDAPLSTAEEIASIRKKIESLGDYQGLGATPEQGGRLQALELLQALEQQLVNLEKGIQ